MENTPPSLEKFKSLPKAEIHIHLEGCFDAPVIQSLATEAGVPLPRPVDQLFQVSGLLNFLVFLDWTCGLVRTPEQLTSAAYLFCQRMTANGTAYADVIINPTHWATWKHRIPEMVEALDRGFTAAEQDGLAHIGLCISLLRTQSAEESLELVEILTFMRHPRVMALSIDGSEVAAGRTGPRFAEAFRRAGAAGLKRTVHAGESSGPEGVWDAINCLGADRIDHGVRAIEDPELVAFLAQRQIRSGSVPARMSKAGFMPRARIIPSTLFAKRACASPSIRTTPRRWS
jgi:adenosine deaminase